MSGRRVLVAAFGHAWLRDQAFGIKLLGRLRREGVPAGVELADWSFGTVTAFQKLAALAPARAILLSSTPRGRTPGTLHRTRPTRELPPPERLQAHVADAVMGMVSVDTLLLLGWYYAALPEDVVLIEAEPVDETWGDDLSPALQRLLQPALAQLRAEIGRPLAGSEIQRV